MHAIGLLATLLGIVCVLLSYWGPAGYTSILRSAGVLLIIVGILSYSFTGPHLPGIPAGTPNS